MNIVFFDDECLICNRAVHLLIRLDRHDQLRFAALKSNTAQQLLRVDDIDSIIYWRDKEVMIYSTAVIAIARDIGLPVRGLLWIPRLVRDSIYRWIANNRYHLNHQQCPVPSPAMRSKILDE